MTASATGSLSNTADPLQSPEARAAQRRAARLQARAARLGDAELDTLFREARSHNGWQAKPVPDVVLRELYDILSFGPTSMNCSPARFIFLRSNAARERLLPALAPANVDKVRTAPVTAIIAQDSAFHERLPELFPHRDAAPMFRDNPALAADTAFRNATLQGAYLIIVARALGLDCGPLSGFDRKAVDATFFEGSTLESNFLCCLGYGDTGKLFQRLPRLHVDTACQFL